jgi:predicted dehydrogenase
MKFLVIGLGSMGKRRVRNLRALGHQHIAGFDPRDDRRQEAASLYAVTPFASYEAALREFKPDALVISTGPRHHMDYALPAAEQGLHCFIEASVVDAERILELDRRVRGKPIVMAPSCTLRYYPGPRKVKELIGAGAIGRPLNLNYQTGQYLPDWHPWEHIRDFYVSDRDTGGAREIVPFELTWLNDIFGHPQPLACAKTKLTDMEADIDDVYHCLLRYPGGMLANLTVEVVSRPKATREMRILGTEGEIVFSGDENAVRTIRLGDAEWQRFPLGVGTIQAGYINPEEPYIAELGDFVKAVESANASLYPNTLEEDVRVLNLLNELERLSTI